MNVQVLTDPFGRLLWASPTLPGSTHDPTAARQHGIIDALADTGLKRCADKAYQGAAGTVQVRSGAAASSGGGVATTAVTPRYAASLSRPRRP
ncbi:transposase family protein [Streptomyces antibioticus]|uniref:transposase family protein n=1 Tax=Streptomyces antibioticus TaxID=1890 RepID=UPI003F6312AC